MKRILLAAAVVVLAATAAFAAPTVKSAMTAAGNVMVDDKGMVLYTYDRDTKGAAASACTATCPVNWPAFVAPADAKADGDWTIVNGGSSRNNANADGSSGWLAWGYATLQRYVDFTASGEYTFTVKAFAEGTAAPTPPQSGLLLVVDGVPVLAEHQHVEPARDP